MKQRLKTKVSKANRVKRCFEKNNRVNAKKTKRLTKIQVLMKDLHRTNSDISLSEKESNAVS